MDPLVAALTAWIVLKTGLIPPDPPRVLLAPRKQMIEMTSGTADPHGLYLHPDRTIFLRNEFRPDDLLSKAVLLHELAHHVLKMNDVQAQCERALEGEAYRLELAWLREQGVDDPHAFLGINELAIVLRSACLD